MSSTTVHVWPDMTGHIFPPEPYVHPGDTIHIGPHLVHEFEVHTHEADVLVVAVVPMGDVVVICWGHSPEPCGAVVYDMAASVTRKAVAA